MARGYPDYEGGKQNVYLTPEWSAKEGKDKNFIGLDANVAWGATTTVDYNVPAAKTLYVSQISFFLAATAAANSELNQIGVAYLRRVTGGVTFYSGQIGGNGGGQTTFPKPMVFPGGSSFRAAVVNRANHNCDVAVTALGYEL